MLVGHKLINNQLKNDILPTWNFGPRTKNCKSVEFITKIILSNWKKTNFKFKINDKVLYFIGQNKSRKDPKLRAQFSGPFIVIKRINDNVLQIQDPITQHKMAAHVSMLKKYKAKEFISINRIPKDNNNSHKNKTAANIQNKNKNKNTPKARTLIKNPKFILVHNSSSAIIPLLASKMIGVRNIIWMT